MNAKVRPLTEVGCGPYGDGYWSRYEGRSRTPPEHLPARLVWLEGWDACDAEIRAEEAEVAP